MRWVQLGLLPQSVGGGGIIRNRGAWLPRSYVGSPFSYYLSVEMGLPRLVHHSRTLLFTFRGSSPLASARLCLLRDYRWVVSQASLGLVCRASTLGLGPVVVGSTRLSLPLGLLRVVFSRTVPAEVADSSLCGVSLPQTRPSSFPDNRLTRTARRL